MLTHQLYDASVEELTLKEIKLGQKYFLYRPRNNKKLREVKEAFHIGNTSDQSKPVVIKIDYSIEENYLTDFRVFEFLDQSYFPSEALQHGITYSHLR